MDQNRRSSHEVDCVFQVVLRRTTKVYLEERLKKCKAKSINTVLTEIIESWVAEDRSMDRIENETKKLRLIEFVGEESVE